MVDDLDREKEKRLRNKRRRRLRLEKHTGLDWIDPEPGSVCVYGERSLWRAVIVQMLEDASNNSQKDEDIYNRDVARHWLTSGSQDFYMVCDLAGFDVGYLKRNVKKALLNNCKWRRESAPKAKPKNRSKKKPADSKVVQMHEYQKKSA